MYSLYLDFSVIQVYRILNGERQYLDKCGCKTNTVLGVDAKQMFSSIVLHKRLVTPIMSSGKRKAKAKTMYYH